MACCEVFVTSVRFKAKLKSFGRYSYSSPTSISTKICSAFLELLHSYSHFNRPPYGHESAPPPKETVTETVHFPKTFYIHFTIQYQVSLASLPPYKFFLTQWNNYRLSEGKKYNVWDHPQTHNVRNKFREYRTNCSKV